MGKRKEIVARIKIVENRNFFLKDKNGFEYAEQL